MKYAALIAALCLVIVAGCNSNPGDDPANMTKAPPAAPGATAPPPNLNKKLPGAAGQVNMGGGGAPGAGAPLAKPPGS